MTVYELMKATEGTLKLMHDNGVNLSDVRFLEAVREYRQAKSAGEKVSYTAVRLSERLGVSERSIYDIVKRMDRTIDL